MPRPPAAVIETGTPIAVIDRKGTGTNIVPTIGVPKRTAHTREIPHDKTEGTVNALATTKLAATMTEGTRRLQNPPKIARVVTMPTTLKREHPCLVLVLVPVARNHP